MIASRQKTLDIQTRLLHLDCMEICLQWYKKSHDKKYYQSALDFGELSNALKLKIEKGDYVEVDKFWERIDQFSQVMHRGPLVS